MRKILLLFFLLPLMIIACNNNQSAKKQKPPANGEYFDGDTVNFTKYIYKNSIVVSECPFKNNRADGTAKEYFNDGKVRLVVEYKDGRRNGMTTSYYETGEKHSEIPYVDSKKEGLAYTYMKNGTVTSEAPYKDNKAVPGIKEFDAKGEPVEQPKGKVVNKGGKTEISLSDPKFRIQEVSTSINNKEYPVSVVKGVGLYNSSVPKGTLFRIIYKTPQGRDGAVDVKY